MARLYRDDYRQAGFPMLPVIEPEGRRAGRQALVCAAALVPANLLPTLVSVSGGIYFALAVALPMALVTTARGLRRQDARHVRLARWTLPLWLSVSETGVLVYVLLYRPTWSL